MSIVSTTFVVEPRVQVDGGTFVRERHVDSAGVAHFVDYLAPAGVNYAAIAAARATALAQHLAQQEVDGLLDGA